MNSDTPSISTAAYTSTSPVFNMDWVSLDDLPEDNAVKRMLNNLPDFHALHKQNQQIETQIMANTQRRIVQVFIADPNDNVPLEHSVLFKGDQKLTDLTDTELFFEVPMSDILKSHNDKRIKFLDKEATKRSGKDVTLDPVKIRELKMVVVNVAQF